MFYSKLHFFESGSAHGYTSTRLAQMTRKYSVSSSERGSVLLEFGLVAIVLFMMIFGIIDFGRALFTYHFVANAAREGTRYASVRGADCNPLMTGCPADSGSIQTYLRGEATGIGVDPNQLNVTTTWPVQSGSPTICTSSFNNPGCTVQVAVSYNFKFVFPFLPTSPLNLSSSSATVITQ